MADLTFELRGALRTCSLQARQRLFDALGGLEENALERLSDPAWARKTIASLSSGARLGLHLLVRLPQGAYAPDLQIAVNTLSFNGGGSHVADELIASGLVVVHRERTLRRREVDRVSVLDPLRARFAGLVDQSRPGGPHRTDPLSREFDLFTGHRASFELGIALAAVRSQRPRGTTRGDLHRQDRRHLLALLTPLKGDEGEASRLLDIVLETRCLRLVDGRFTVDDEEVAQLDGVRELLLRHVGTLSHRAPFMAAFGLLLETPGWIERRDLLEPAVLAMLDEWPMDLDSQVRELVRTVSHVPGVVREGEGDHEWFCLAPSARAVLEDEDVPSTPVTAAIRVQPDFRLLVEPGAPLQSIVELAAWARLESADRVATFRLESTTIRRAAAEGRSPTGFLHLLETHVRDGVPPNVARAISDWSTRRGNARVVEGTVLVADVEERELARLLGSRRFERLAPGVFLLDEARPQSLAEPLRRAGIACRLPSLQAPDDEDRPPPPFGPQLAAIARQCLQSTRRVRRPR